MVSDGAKSGANGNARMKVIATLLLFALSALHAADTQLPAGVRSALDLRHVPSDTLSIYVADLDSGETVLDWRGDVPRNPASTMKVLTTLAALDILGPTYRWRTDVFVQGDLKAGRLEGDLELVGDRNRGSHRQRSARQKIGQKRADRPDLEARRGTGGFGFGAGQLHGGVAPGV